MRKQIFKRNAFLIISSLFIMNSFMNCSGFEENGSSIELVQTPVERQNYTVQSSEQLIRSLASVTGVEYTNTVLNEYNARKALMSSDYTLESVTAPMLISVSNLSSQFCNELVKKEANLTMPNRNYFKSVDLNKGVSEFKDEHFNDVLNTLGNKFWGRELSSEERTILGDLRQEFITAIPEASRNSSTQTRNLIVSICTSMLSAFDFITL